MAKDMFSGASLGGMEKYNEVNAKAHRIERAGELDDRIREFCSRKKDIAWCEEAADFCERETLANKDIFELSQEANRFPQILEEAKTLKKKFENEAIAKKQAKADGIIAEAKSIDNQIRTLSSAARSKFWCDEVTELVHKVKGGNVEKEVMLACRELDTLDALDRESHELIRAIANDDIVRNLSARKMGNDAVREIISFYDEIPPVIASMMKEYGTLKALYEKAIAKKYEPEYSRYEKMIGDVERNENLESYKADFWQLDKAISKLEFDITKYVADFNSRWATAKRKVSAFEKELSEKAKIQAKIDAEKAAAKEAAAKETARVSEAKKYEHFLNEVEGGAVQEIYGQFATLEKKIPTLDFYLEKYIDNFVSRWASAKKLVDDEKARRKKISDAEANARAKAKAKRAAKERRAELLSDIWHKILPFLPYIIVALAGFISGLVVSSARGWLFGVGAAALAFMLTERVSAHVRADDDDRVFVGIIINSIVSVVAVVFAFFGLYEISICLAVPVAVYAFMSVHFAGKAYHAYRRSKRGGVYSTFSFEDHNRAVGFSIYSMMPALVGLGMSALSLLVSAEPLTMAIGGAVGFVISTVILLIVTGKALGFYDGEGVSVAHAIVCMAVGAVGIALSFITATSLGGFIIAAAALVSAIALFATFAIANDGVENFTPFVSMFACIVMLIAAAIGAFAF